MKLDLEEYKNIIFLTGAGVSVDSGLPTYRGENSTTAVDIQYSGHIDRIKDNPKALWEFYGPLRQSIQKAQPNAVHFMLAKLEACLADDQRFCLLTQNVDGLHQKAGSKRVIELHGNIETLVCSNGECNTEKVYGSLSAENPPLCEMCGSVLRPGIVLFGEPMPVSTEWSMKKALRSCDLFVAVGTSGTVSPASNIVRSARYEGARTILLNLEPMVPNNSYFVEEYLGDASVLMSGLFDTGV